MAPHSMDTILQPPQWPIAFSSFITWCLMWDPKNRPTSRQALDHEFFADAIDPLRPKSSASRLLGRKHSDLSFKSAKDSHETPPTTSKPSWFRRSLIARESAPAVPQYDSNAKSIHKSSALDLKASSTNNGRPSANKRATWTNGVLPAGGAPMPILPSIRAISPLSNAVTAQASSRIAHHEGAKTEGAETADEKSKKIGRQLSVNSHSNHYADLHRQEAERSLNGGGPLMSPPYGQKESLISHLRKRVRRLSGRHGLASPNGDDVEANAGAPQWSNRSSMVVDNVLAESGNQNDFTDLGKALQNVRYSLERPRLANDGAQPYSNGYSNHATLKRQHSTPQAPATQSAENLLSSITPVSTRTRRALQMATHPVHQYETPDEEDELLDEVLNSTHRAARRLDHHYKADEQKHRVALKQKDDNRQALPFFSHHLATPDSYPTPSTSAKRDGVFFGQETTTPSQPLNITKNRSENNHINSLWPTPPYEESEWATAATASIFATGSNGR
jgi:meiosis induction protein kinase IME2/SME1